ncbi:MAG: cell filamentation protein Fic [Pelagibacterium sp. SCN 64-44]|nr:MAG: cell filamentation protein Fic [Pelagibacterium sp. SCN 64-44]
MATPNEKLAEALQALREAQGPDGRKVFKTEEFSRTIRERLQAFGFLVGATKGWLYLTNPNARPGDTTPWIASFWEFCAAYANDRYGSDWHVTAEQSLLLATEHTVIPDQAILCSPGASNTKVNLPFGNSIFNLTTKPADPADVEIVDGIRRLKVPVALTMVPESFFKEHRLSAQLALRQVRSASEVLGPLLDRGASTVAGRLAGAFRYVGNDRFADDIVGAMTSMHYDVREQNPFDSTAAPVVLVNANAVAGRIAGLWQNCRQEVIDRFPPAPGLPVDADQYLSQVEEVYKSDAYHSLSIEGYSVTEELIERVRAGDWNPEANPEDERNRDALAARGYWEAFQLVKKSVSEILVGGDPAAIVERDHNAWYRALFAPSVAANILRPRDLAGYRNHPVFIVTSDYVPPRAEAIMDGMTALFEQIRDEPEPGVRAILGHWLFGYIHPYPDGNGRTGRFLLNALLASGGYPWTIIRKEDRAEYLAALNAASISANITPFAELVARRVDVAMQERPVVPATKGHTN